MSLNLLTDSIAAGILMDNTYLPQLRAGGIRGIERLIFVVMIVNVLWPANMWNSWIRSLSDGVMCSEPAGTAGASTEPAVGAAAGDNVLVGISSVRAATGTAALIGSASAGAAQKATEVSAGVAAGPTAVLVGNESTGAAALVGKVAAGEESEATVLLSRTQAKNLRKRLKSRTTMHTKVHELMD